MRRNHDSCECTNETDSLGPAVARLLACRDRQPRRSTSWARKWSGSSRKIIDALEADEHVRVVIFDSAVDDYFLNHSDFLAKLEFGRAFRQLRALRQRVLSLRTLPTWSGKLRSPGWFAERASRRAMFLVRIRPDESLHSLPHVLRRSSLRLRQEPVRKAPFGLSQFPRGWSYAIWADAAAWQASAHLTVDAYLRRIS